MILFAFLKDTPGSVGNDAAEKARLRLGNQVLECVYSGQNPNYKGLNQDEIIVHIAFCSVYFPARFYICHRRKD